MPSMRLLVLSTFLKEAVNFGVIPGHPIEVEGEQVSGGSGSGCYCHDLWYCRLNIAGDGPNDLGDGPAGSWSSLANWCFHNCYRKAGMMNSAYTGSWINAAKSQAIGDAQYLGGCGDLSIDWLKKACDPSLMFKLDEYRNPNRSPALAGVSNISIPTVFEESARDYGSGYPYASPLCSQASAASSFGSCGGEQVADCGDVAVSDCVYGEFYEVVNQDYASGKFKRSYCSPVKNNAGANECRVGVSESVECSGDSLTAITANNCHKETKNLGSTANKIKACATRYKGWTANDGAPWATPCEWNSGTTKCDSKWGDAVART